MRHGSGGVRRCHLAFGAFALLFLAWILGGFGSAHQRLTVSDVSFVAVALTAAVSCAMAARREQGRLRRAWILFATAYSLWSVGNLCWTYYQLAADHQPYPSWADVFWLAAVPFVLAGMLTFPSRPTLLSGRLRTLLDGLIVAGSLLLVSWEIVLGPTYRASGQAALATVVALAYPIVDVVVIAGALSLVVRMGSGSRMPTSLVAAGLISYALSDSFYAYLAVHGRFEVGTWVDAGWVFGFLLAALGATARSGAMPSVDASERRMALVGALIPYLAVAVAIFVVARQRLAPDAFTMVTGLAVIVLVITRQFLVVLENISLTRNLEVKVQLRTSELNAAGRRFESLVQNSSDVIAVVDPQANVIYHSPSIQRVLGYDAAELADSSLLDIVHPEDREHVVTLLAGLELDLGSDTVIQFRLRQGSGRWRHVEAVATNLLDDESVHGLVLNIRDVTERTNLEDQLRHRAFHDPLTGLANRTLLQERVDHALVRAGRTHDDVVVLLLDLDGFKYVNDSLGHAVGDAVLIETGKRILGCVSQSDTVARLGGDEFAILLDRPQPDGAAVADRILAELALPVEVGGRQFVAQASIGIAACNTGLASSQELIRDADAAMYIAKARGKGRFQAFEPSMHQAMQERLELEADLRLALERDELVLHYQPVYSMASGRMTGVEALVRWEHPTRGLVFPADFIPLAEETGLILSIGWWVLEEATRQVGVWQDRYHDHPPLVVSVNLSVKQLQQPTMFDSVTRALHAAHLPAHSLVLELTETVLMEEDDSASLVALERLDALGVQLAIDDFGTGYSSLGRLRSLPVAKLKIDRSFVREVDGTSDEPPLVAAIIAMAHSLGLGVVAEGVETPEQLHVLSGMGCDEVQGYYTGRPTPAKVIGRLLDEASVLTNVLAR
ncbi:MAG: putative bifunctional diguanylate cyclase/phosphodiesterase [Acidimicrobiales bacterium]